MKDRISSSMDFCEEIEFGRIRLSEDEKRFRFGLNRQILQVIRTLPHPVQTKSLLFLVDHLKLPLESEVDFFMGFYPPAWTLLYWILATFTDKGTLSEKDLHHYQAVHAIAMLLHLMDDHLTDGEIPTTHITLLLRSQFWMAMNRTLADLTEGNDSESHSVQQYINRYYGAIEDPKEPDSLDAYCEQFKDQMGMGYIAPVQLIRRLSASDHLAVEIQATFAAFGCAWRLLDDLQDISRDMEWGVKTAAYFCLSEDMKRLWGCQNKAKSLLEKPARKGIQKVFEKEIARPIITRICRELDVAASIADGANIKGYAEELLALAAPLRTLAGDRDPLL